MVLLYAVASWGGLEALRSVLSFIVPYIGLAIIVLFQSEIRRTLARIGRKRWLGAGFTRRNRPTRFYWPWNSSPSRRSGR
jgi:diadenylate cyclase